jgi:hypothetical protein
MSESKMTIRLCGRGSMRRHIALVCVFWVGWVVCQQAAAQVPAPRMTPAEAAAAKKAAAAAKKADAEEKKKAEAEARKRKAETPKKQTPPGPAGAAGPAATPVEPEAAEPDDDPQEIEYKSLPVNDSLKRSSSKIDEILKARAFNQNVDEFDKYYNEYALPRWTVQKEIVKAPAARDIPALAKYRRELRSQFYKAKGGDVYDHLNKLVLDFMSRVAADDLFHPAARVNALLTIGDLYRAEPSSGSIPPVPLPEALPVLLATVENAQMSDGLRAAAMIGVVRHAELGVQDPTNRSLLIAAMLRLAAADLPAGPAGPGRAWILGQAVKTLGLLGELGADNAVFKALLKIVADGKLPLSVRAVAADALGRLGCAGATGLGAADAAAAVGQFVLDACDTEPGRIEKLKAEAAAITPAAAPVAGPEPAAAAPAAATASDAKNDPLRRSMVQLLNAALTALAGPDASGRTGVASIPHDASQEAWAWVLKLKDVIESLRNALDDRRRTEKDMTPTVKKVRGDIEAHLKKKP